MQVVLLLVSDMVFLAFFISMLTKFLKRGPSLRDIRIESRVIGDRDFQRKKGSAERPSSVRGIRRVTARYAVSSERKHKAVYIVFLDVRVLEKIYWYRQYNTKYSINK